MKGKIEMILERLPPVRGKIRSYVPLAVRTWFGVGGAAEVLFQPVDLEDLRNFLSHCPTDIPISVIGMTSNLLIRDGGIRGVVIKLGRGFTTITPSDTTLHVGAAALDHTVAKIGCAAGIAGLEFFIGIPGTIGGAIRMNAGAFGYALSDVLVDVHALDRRGQSHHLQPRDLGFGYRRCQAASELIFVSATLLGPKDHPSLIAERINVLNKKRTTNQPIHRRTAGCTFVNPPQAAAWQLIDQAHCRGLTYGGAKVSEHHCNFLINTANAHAWHIERLGEEVIARVVKATGIVLNWEIKRIGQSNTESLPSLP